VRRRNGSPSAKHRHALVQPSSLDALLPSVSSLFSKLLTKELDLKILKAIDTIRHKKPEVYGQEPFFEGQESSEDESEGEGEDEEGDEEQPKRKGPVTVRDHLRVHGAAALDSGEATHQSHVSSAIIPFWLYLDAEVSVLPPVLSSRLCAVGRRSFVVACHVPLRSVSFIPHVVSLSCFYESIYRHLGNTSAFLYYLIYITQTRPLYTFRLWKVLCAPN